jgi:hypothetical protein
MIDRVHGVADAQLDDPCLSQVVGEFLSREALNEGLETIAREGCFFIALTFRELVHSFVQ